MSLDRRAVMGLSLGAGLAIAGAASAQTRGRADVTGDPAGRFAAAVAEIDAYAAEHVAAHSLPGLTLSLIGPDGFTGLLRYGYADVERRTPVAADHLFQIGSISKSFTALCIFRLIEAGRLAPETEVSRLLPEVPLPSDGRITVQSLLNHSSGLPDDAPIFPRGGDGRLWQGFPVGAHWSYSNLGYALLSEIAARVEGRPYPQVLQRLVLDPLELHATRPAILAADRDRYARGYSPFYTDRPYPRGGRLAPGPWSDMTEGSGCVASTGADMARYMRWLVAAGEGHGAPLLSDAAAKRFCAPTIDAPGWATPDAKYANGLAVTPVGGRPLLHHTGGMLTFNSAIHVDPIAGVGGFASTNVGLIPYRPRAITAFACARLRAVAEGAPAARPDPAAPSPPPVETFVGRYRARDGRILQVAAAPRGLLASIGGRGVEMEAGGPGVFIAVDPAASARILAFRGGGHAVARAWWGEDEFVRLEAGAPVAGFSPPPSPRLAALAGFYESDDPWRGAVRVIAQGEALLVDGVNPMTPLADGGFRVGENDWSPERARFDAEIGGRPQRATISGVDYLRRPA